MISFLLWALLLLGVLYVSTCSVLFIYPRVFFARFGELARAFSYCPLCQSFWLGALLFWFEPFMPHASIVWRIPISAVAAMGLIALLKGAFPQLLPSEMMFLAEQIDDPTPKETQDE